MKFCSSLLKRQQFFIFYTTNKSYCLQLFTKQKHKLFHTGRKGRITEHFYHTFVSIYDMKGNVVMERKITVEKGPKDLPSINGIILFEG